MRVAFLSHNARQHDALGNQIAEKARFFQERGAEVRVFVEDARLLHVDVRPLAHAVNEVAAQGPVWDYLRQADLVFAVYAQYHDLLQFLPALAGAGPRIVFDYHGVTPPTLAHAHQREGLERSARLRGFAWCADHVLTTSRFTASELSKATSFPAEHTTVLPLPVDVERFQAEPRARWLHERLGIDGRILLYVGRLAGNKRVPLLIESLGRLADPNVHAAIIGDIGDVYADEASRCRALAERLGVDGRVHWLGQLDDADLPRAYRSADVFVMPSLHEGFCVPVIEAMACGVPVVASRSAALPETLGDAGLTFVPDDAEDLARVLGRVLGNSSRNEESARSVDFSPHGPSFAWTEVHATTTPSAAPRRIAVVSFRYGPDIVGGAETSLRALAMALRSAGQHVEVFTTCTNRESHWQNDLPAGTVTLDDIRVHRFPIDAHDAAAHSTAFRAILDADGAVTPDVEHDYLAHSIHSSALIEALRQSDSAFDAILLGPYLFGLTADVLTTFPHKTLLAPCFHDEPLARLALWPNLCRDAGGVLYHSLEERLFAQQTLGVNHPNACEIGARITPGSNAKRAGAKPYVLYCGRYSEQKNVPLLLDWARRYHMERPGLEFVFIGQGDLKLPREPWLRDLGRVDETTKRAIMRGAAALVQLSMHESLSLVALEAWAEETPLIAHAGCAVLRGQIQRSQGGMAIGDYESFAAVLDDLRANPDAWQARGERGREYVASRYGSANAYAQTILGAIHRLRVPVATQMRDRGLERANGFARALWQTRFAEFVDRVLTQPPRPLRERVVVEPLHASIQVAAGTRTLLATVRLRNLGTHAAAPDGPGRTIIAWSVIGTLAAPRRIRLPALLMPGNVQVAALPIGVPDGIGSYRVQLWTERVGAEPSEAVEIVVNVSAHAAGAPAGASAFLDTIAATLPRTHELQQLPTSYADVTEGRFAPLKRFVKQKILHNFKHAYVDVLSRQQSDVNGQVVLMIQQLAECCQMLDHAVRGIHERLDGLEAKIEHLLAAESEPAGLETTASLEPVTLTELRG